MLITINDSAAGIIYYVKGVEPVIILIKVLPIKYCYCLAPVSESYSLD